MSVDIIIPVYNGFEDIVRCMESIRQHTDLIANRLFLVNDKSPDERILPFLEEQAGENIIVINSEVNEGFSASVNKGIQSSDRDVILLNSDTVVTSNWVEKIVKCAYSDASIGTVTPFSNSATLCSIPNFGIDNEIPKNVSIDEMAEIVERVSVHKYPQITVAVGFCMFIKRSVIQEVGLFDAVTFEKGYGEENDFCNRAEQYGYYHVLCDDTFIYHKGTASFMSSEKKRLIESHNKILDKRYKSQMLKNHLYCVQNPDQDLRDHLEPFWRLKNKKRNILYVIHSDFRNDSADHVGGTQLHVKDLVMSLKAIYNVFVISRDGEYLRLTIYIDDKRISYKFFVGGKPLYFQFHNSKLEQLYKMIIRVFSIGLVHVHHVFGLSLDIFTVAAEYQVPLTLTLHDYYYICPTIKLFTHDEKVCEGTVQQEYCKECMFRNCEIVSTVDYLEKWRKNMKKIFSLCDKVYTPSERAKKIYLQYYPELEYKIQVIEHGLDRVKLVKKMDVSANKIVEKKVEYYIEQHLTEENNIIAGWAYIAGMDNKDVKIVIDVIDKNGYGHRFMARKQQRPDLAERSTWYEETGFRAKIDTNWFVSGKLQVKVIAVLDEDQECIIWEEIFTKQNNRKIKDGRLNVAFIGGTSVEKGSKLIKKVITSDKQHVNWFIFGEIGDRTLQYMEQINLVKTGNYEREELMTMLTNFNIDLICILPVWNETFCYTLSEAVMSGIPVIVTDVGAVADRVKEHHYGWVVSVKNGDRECIDKIKEFMNDSSILENKKNELANMSFKSVREMSEEYNASYNLLWKDEADKPEPCMDDYRILYHAIKLGSANVKGDYLVAEELNNQLQSMLSSTSYKLAAFLMQMRIPFKRQIKNILLKIYRLKGR